MEPLMALDTPQPRATYQDVLDAPPEVVAELIDGVLYTQSRPAGPHTFAASSLGDELVSPFQKARGGPGGWWIVDEPQLNLDGDILVPDLAGWRKDRMPSYPSAAEVDLAPDWVCEILSPSTRKLDLVKKRPLYAHHGVGHLWHIDPLARALEVFVLHDGIWSLVATHGDDEEVSVPPFEAIRFKLSDLWI